MEREDLSVQSTVLISPPPAPRRASRKPLMYVAGSVLAVALIVLAAILGGRLRSSPAGGIDTPPDGAVLSQQTSVSGWAVDQSAHGNTWLR